MVCRKYRRCLGTIFLKNNIEPTMTSDWFFDNGDTQNGYFVGSRLSNFSKLAHLR